MVPTTMTSGVIRADNDMFSDKPAGQSAAQTTTTPATTAASNIQQPCYCNHYVNSVL